MNFKKRDIVLFVLLAFFIGLLGAYTGLKLFQPEAQPNATTESIDILPNDKKTSQNLDDEMDKVKQAYELIDQNYVGEVEEGQLLEGAIDGMLETLDDPYSSFMTSDRSEEHTSEIQSSFQGIGAEVSMVEGKVTIVAPIKDSPAARAGLRPTGQS